MKTFTDKVSELLEEKRSILCVGLDPALPEQRDENVIPSTYLEGADENQARLNFCLDMIEQTADFCVAAKPNEQYVHGLTPQQHQKLTNFIQKHGLFSIYDCKLSDIRDTAQSALFHYHRWGYDTITVSPFPGNTEEVVRIAHEYDPQIGIIVLTLMSNPEAERFMRHARIGNKPAYLAIAEDVRKFGADGCVVGATGHVTEKDLKLIRATVGEDKLFLIPGVGAQRGDPERAIKAGGRNIIINVGRDIIYSDNPRRKAKEYCELFRKIRCSTEHSVIKRTT